MRTLLLEANASDSPPIRESVFGGRLVLSDPNYNLYSVWPQEMQPAYMHQFTLVSKYALTNELSLSADITGRSGTNWPTIATAINLLPSRLSGSGPQWNCGAAIIPTMDQTPYFNLVGECGAILFTECAAEMTYNAGQLTLRQRTRTHAELHRQVDLSLFKDFHPYGQQHVFGFRADFFNIFNLASYENPDNNITDTSFGLISGVRSPPRQIQLCLHYAF